VNDAGHNGKQRCGLKTCGPVFVVLAIVLIVVLNGCDTGEVEEIGPGERIDGAEVLKTAPKQSEDVPPSQAQGEPLRLSVGLTVEPYVFESPNSEDGDSGFEVDIVREALALGGYDVDFVHEPLKRTKTSFLQKTVDGVMTIKEHYPEIQGSFLSDEYMTYYNVVVTLQSRHLKIDDIADLTDKEVIAFQQARLAFGKDFELMTTKNPRYREMADQDNQIAMFFLGRTDAIVLDRWIFQYHRNCLADVPTDQPVTVHPLFEPSSFRIAFRDSKTRDVFNLELRKMKKSGRYMEIINSYIDKELRGGIGIESVDKEGQE
jgi:polar amino acid transport system substrate-binding protein